MSPPAPWIEFDHVGKDEQYTLLAKRWVVTSNGREETIIAIKDYGPVLHGIRTNGTEVCFSPACVVRHYNTKRSGANKGPSTRAKRFKNRVG